MVSKPFVPLASAFLALILAPGPPLGAEGTGAADASLTETERAALIDMLERGRAETQELLARAEGEWFTRKPAEDRWSVSEVLEHIAATEELLLGMAQGALAADPDPDWQQLMEALPIDGFAERVRDRSQRAQAPEVVQPKGAQTREEGLARFLAAREETIELVRSTEAPVRQHTAEVPGGKMTVHHFLTVIAAHTLRHNQQIAEVLEQLEGSGG